MPELSDERLLEEFLRGEGFESEIAFRTLVVHHGPMVLEICRQVLIQDADAEDVFQTTFFVFSAERSLDPQAKGPD